MTKIFLIITLFVSVSFSQTSARFHGDFQDNSGRFADTLLKPPLKLKWRYFTEGTFKGGPIVFNGRVFAVDRQGQVYCLNAETGDLIWKHYFLGREGITPLAFGEYLYYHSAGTGYYDQVGYFHCVRQDNGKEVWKKSSVGGVVVNRGRYSPIAFNNRIYFFGTTGKAENTAKIFCFDPLTGSEIWTKTYGPIVGAGGLNPSYMVICTTGTTPLLISSYTSGASENWRTKFQATFALIAGTGETVWENTEYGGKLALYKNVLYMNTASVTIGERFVAANALTGDTLYTSRHGLEFKPSVDENFVFSRGYGGSVTLWDRATGATRGSCDWSGINIAQGGRVLSGCGYPSIANGYGYCGFGHGGYAVDGYDPPGGIPRADKAQGIYAFKIPDAGGSSPQVVWYYKMASNICTTPFITRGKIYWTTNQEGAIYCFENAQ